MTRRRLLVGAGAAAVAAAVAAVGLGAAPDPTHADGFCLRCHVDLVESHRTGAHRNVACIACHMEPGLAGEVEGRWHGVRHLRLAALQDPRDPHHPPVVPVANATCRGCHATLADELIGEAWKPLVRPTVGLAPLGLRPNHSGHLGAAAESCALCHGPSHRPLSVDPLACGVCHPTVGHARERTARARSPGAFDPIAPPVPPPQPPLRVEPEEGEGEGDGEGGGATGEGGRGTGDEPTKPLRCSPAGMARCGACHNGQSHGNGTKPPGLPDITAGGDTFTCRRCHPTGRWSR